MRRDWRDISYLSEGNTKQRLVYNFLVKHNLLEVLSDFDPAVVSTICVGLDTSMSDIDIICSCRNLALLEEILKKHYSEFEKFKFFYKSTNSETLVCSFMLDDFEVEIFAAREPVEQQNGWVHLSVMDRLVSLGGNSFREAIVDLKNNGLKTEPAIAKHLSLDGDPYIAVADLANKSDLMLLKLIKRSI
jgi:hypothetical protein